MTASISRICFVRRRRLAFRTLRQAAQRESLTAQAVFHPQQATTVTPSEIVNQHINNLFTLWKYSQL
jgi:hypothetical protein